MEKEELHMCFKFWNSLIVFYIQGNFYSLVTPAQGVFFFFFFCLELKSDSEIRKEGREFMTPFLPKGTSLIGLQGTCS